MQVPLGHGNLGQHFRLSPLTLPAAEFDPRAAAATSPASSPVPAHAPPRALSAPLWEPPLSFFAATWAAVRPEEFFCDALAPSASRCSTIAPSPSSAARCSG